MKVRHTMVDPDPFSDVPEHPTGLPDPTKRLDGKPATYKAPPPEEEEHPEWGPWTDPRPHVHYYEEAVAGFVRPADFVPPDPGHVTLSEDDSTEELLVKALRMLGKRGVDLSALVEKANEEGKDDGS